MMGFLLSDDFPIYTVKGLALTSNLNCILVISLKKMDVSITTTKASCHGRSNSLPSKSHPFIVSVEDQLQGSRSSEAASSSPFLSAKTWLHLRICLNVYVLTICCKCQQHKKLSGMSSKTNVLRMFWMDLSAC